MPNQKPCGFLVSGVLRGKTPKTLGFHGKPPKRFTLVKLRKTKTAARPGRQEAGCDTFMSFCGAKTHSPETAWMPNQKPCGFLVSGVLRSKTPKTLEFHAVKLRKTKTALRFWFAQGIAAEIPEARRG
jgi:hypothetical protein